MHAKLFGAMRAIELANTHQWRNLWLEADYELVIRAFKNHALVPWHLRNMWLNYMLLTRSMNFMATHIFREGNAYADLLASGGHNLANIIVWINLPSCISESFYKNRFGLPNVRFVTY